MSARSAMSLLAKVTAMQMLTTMPPLGQATTATIGTNAKTADAPRLRMKSRMLLVSGLWMKRPPVSQQVNVTIFVLFAISLSAKVTAMQMLTTTPLHGRPIMPTTGTYAKTADASLCWRKLLILGTKKTPVLYVKNTKMMA